MYFREVFRFSSWEERIVGTLIFLFPVFFLTVKSWSIVISFLLFLAALFYISRDPGKFFYRWSRYFWCVAFVLLIPFGAELLAQLTRVELIGGNLDGPSRFIVAMVLFLYLSQIGSRKRAAFWFGYGAICATLVTSVSVYFFRDYFWQDINKLPTRFATYFVDPNTVGCYQTVLLVAALATSYFSYGKSSIRIGVSFVSVICAVFVILGSQSRSAWGSLIAGLVVFVAIVFPWKKALALGVAGLLSFTLIFSLSIRVQDRVQETIAGVKEWTQGSTDTSTGTRITLAKIDLTLIRLHPFTGVKDGSLPPYDELKKEVPELDEHTYNVKLLAGSHAEILAQLVRKGVFFGSLAVFALFIFPMFFFARAPHDSNCQILSRVIGLTTVVVLTIAGLGIQIFNLKMTSSFWGVFLAVYFSSSLNDYSFVGKTENS